jgi:hypothetical protein
VSGSAILSQSFLLRGIAILWCVWRSLVVLAETVGVRCIYSANHVDFFMQNFSRIIQLLVVVALAYLVSACAPEVGSPDWCKSIEEKPKGDITINEAKDYAKHCVFK